MSDTTASLRRKIGSAGDLHSVVRTMKAMAASSIGQYENAVRSLDDYYRTVQLGLSACFRQSAELGVEIRVEPQEVGTTLAIVFGSDQGLVGLFNGAMADFVMRTLKDLPGKKVVWTIGERMHAHLAETGVTPGHSFTLPNSIRAIAQLVGQILLEIERQSERGGIAPVYVFHQRPASGSVYAPVSQRLLPLDQPWQRDLTAIRWPTKNLPEVMNEKKTTLLAFVHEFLFVSLFRACAESLASENASRLAAMQRAEKNIDELLDDLNRTLHRLRQSGIDEELFDLVSGFEALTSK